MRPNILLITTDQQEQLFDLETDPHELQDRSADAGPLKPMREKMAAHMQARDHVKYEPAKLVPMENRPPSHGWSHPPRPRRAS